jgi:hypothetical protein
MSDRSCDPGRDSGRRRNPEWSPVRLYELVLHIDHEQGAFSGDNIESRIAFLVRVARKFLNELF